MNLVKNKTRFAGSLLIFAMIAGILSVAPSVDSAKYLTQAAIEVNQVIMASLFQFLMGLAYIGFAILLYPLIKKHGETLAVGFLSFRIMAASLVMVGTIILLAILVLSKQYASLEAQEPTYLIALGNMLKISRDYINHVFMILVWSIGNLIFYTLLIKSKLIPRWLSAWGLLGALLAAIASLLVLFEIFNVITTEYIALNVPAALSELVMGIWLMVKGLNNKSLTNENGVK